MLELKLGIKLFQKYLFNALNNYVAEQLSEIIQKAV